MMKNSEYLTASQILSAPLIAMKQLHLSGPVFILAPHPDDEALGCSGLILQLQKLKIPVWIGFMTSGEASHLGSKKYPPYELASLREKEAIRACKILGIPNSHIIFYRGPDSLLNVLCQEEKVEIERRLAKDLEKLNISLLLLPWRRDPHTDHRASYEIAAAVLDKMKQKIKWIEYPIWLWKKSDEKDWPLNGEVKVCRLCLNKDMSIKRKAIFAHQSQTSNLITDDPNGFHLTEELLSPFLEPYESYFLPIFKKSQKK